MPSSPIEWRALLLVASSIATQSTHDIHDLIFHAITGSKEKRSKALATIKAPVDGPDKLSPHLSNAVRNDLRYAEDVISQAVTASSWDRNASWARKFSTYVAKHCQAQVAQYGATRTLTSDTIATAFLASVVRENPEAHTRITAAKRAVNYIRAFARKQPVDDNVSIRYLARGARKAIVRTVRQSPALLAVFVAAITLAWGKSPVWWKRQISLMILITFCTLARGAGVTGCLRRGISWVRYDGTQCSTPTAGARANCQQTFRGFLILFPTRKNHRDSPSWVPIAEKSAKQLMASHLRWLETMPSVHYMFPARKRQRTSGRKGVYFIPNNSAKSRMSTSSFRTLLRLALVECCGLSADQAKLFGTHGPRLGSMEELRKCGVPAELRQQLGAWMSQSVALSYLQLNPSAQFDVLDSISPSNKSFSTPH